MHFIDIIILVPLIWAGFRGFSKGLIIEVVSAAALIIGVWCGIHFSDYIGDFVKAYISEKYEPVVSFAIIFIAVVILIFVLGKALEKVVNLASLKLVNKLAGALFGVAKIVLVLSFLMLIISRFDTKFDVVPDEIKEESLLYQPMVDLSKLVMPAIQKSDTFFEDELEENQTEVIDKETSL